MNESERKLQINLAHDAESSMRNSGSAALFPDQFVVAEITYEERIGKTGIVDFKTIVSNHLGVVDVANNIICLN